MTCCFIVRLESRMNPKFLTFSENSIWSIPTLTDDGKQSEGRESVEKKINGFIFVLAKFELMAAIP